MILVEIGVEKSMPSLTNVPVNFPVWSLVWENQMDQVWDQVRFMVKIPLEDQVCNPR